MKSAQIENGKVTNVILGSIAGAITCDDTVAIGDLWDGSTFTKPAPDVAGMKAAFIKKVDADVDAIYDAAIGNRGPEYDQASAEANAFKTAGYTGTVPASVSSWSAAKGWTAQAAADDIIAAAARLTTARDAIRAQRLLRKEQAKAAVDAAALATVTAQWAGFVSYIRGQLGV